EYHELRIVSGEKADKRRRVISLHISASAHRASRRAALSGKPERREISSHSSSAIHDADQKLSHSTRDVAAEDLPNQSRFFLVDDFSVPGPDLLDEMRLHQRSAICK